MDSKLMLLFYAVDLFGTAIFAVSGVLLACRLKMDPFGVIVLSGVTAIGGGTLRDLILGANPVFWIADVTYLWVIIITCIVAILIIRKLESLSWWILPVCDAIGLATFLGIGIEKSLVYQSSSLVAIMMGVITGCGGGIIRDTLAREIPMIMRHEIYATACIIGGIFYTGSLAVGFQHSAAFIIGVCSTLILRLIAIRWHLSLPTFTISK